MTTVALTIATGSMVIMTTSLTKNQNNMWREHIRFKPGVSIFLIGYRKTPRIEKFTNRLRTHDIYGQYFECVQLVSATDDALKALAEQLLRGKRFILIAPIHHSKPEWFFRVCRLAGVPFVTPQGGDPEVERLLKHLRQLVHRGFKQWFENSSEGNVRLSRRFVSFLMVSAQAAEKIALNSKSVVVRAAIERVEYRLGLLFNQEPIARADRQRARRLSIALRA